MRFLNFRNRVGYLLVFLRHRGLLYALKYLWVYLYYATDFFRGNRLFRWIGRFEHYPRMIEVETTTVCGLRCTMCEHTYWDYPPRNMTFEQFKGIVDQFPTLYWIGMTGIGSSFCNRDFLPMLEYVKARGVIVEMYDTFYELDVEKIERVVRCGVDRLIASVDGCTAEVYERIRVKSDFERVTANIRTLVETKRRLRSPFPQLSFHFIVSRENVGQIADYVDFVDELTAGEHCGILFSTLLSAFAEVQPLAVGIPPEAKADAERRARRRGVTLLWNKITREDKPPMRECTEWSQPFIFVDGSVIPCCASNEHNCRRYQIDHALGNVFEQSFREIWDGPRYRQLRRMIRAGGVPPSCVACPSYALPPKAGFAKERERNDG